MTQSRIGIAWNWDDALRGAIGALPAVPVIVAVNVSAGICMAMGTLLVAILGVPREQKARLRGLIVAGAFAVAYAAGCVLGEWPVVAVGALSALAYVSVLAASHRPAARLLVLLCVPGFAIGMNEPAPDGFVIAAMFVAGGLWATFVAVMWHPVPPSAIAPARFSALGRMQAGERAIRVYAICFALALGIALALGFILDLQHVAWGAAAAAFIMRPDPGLLASRALGRILATFIGVCLAAVFFHQGLAEAALAAITVLTVSAMIATRTSAWYVMSAGSGLLVLLMSGISSTQQFELSFHDRLVETAIGAALAMLFGVITPRLLQGRGARAIP